MLLSQVGPYSLLLHQRPGASGNTAHLTGGGRSTQQVRNHWQHSCITHQAAVILEVC
jgi:hypothetical protein